MTRIAHVTFWARVFALALALPQTAMAGGIADCTSVPADRTRIGQCAAISATDWPTIETTAKEVAEIAMDSAADTDDPDRLRSIVADLVGYVALLSAKSAPKLTGGQKCCP